MKMTSRNPLPSRKPRRQGMVALAGAIALAGIGAWGCNHTRTVGDAPRRGTTDGQGNPQVDWNPLHPLVVDSPAKLLRPGAGRRIQKALEDEGYLVRPDLDELGDATTEGLRRFQLEKRLAATGFPDAETLRQLGLGPDAIYLPPPSRAQMETMVRQDAEARREAPAREAPRGAAAGE